MAKKKKECVLVTGGAGYIGCVLVPALLGAGYQVRVFDKLVFGADPLQITLEKLHQKVEVVQGDVCSFDDSVLDDITSVIHLAGLSNDPTSEFNPQANLAINVGGTKNIANACVTKKVNRFIFASSCSIYYSLSPYTGMLTEESEVNPTAPYSLSKKLAEEYLCSLKSPDFSPTFLRKGTIFGWSPRMRYDLVVNAFLKDSWQKGRVTVLNGGEVWRPLLNINDACEAYIKTLQMPIEKVSGQAFNVLHKNYRILELAHWLKHLLHDRKNIEVDVQYNTNVPPRSYQVSGDKFQETFGFTPWVGIGPEMAKIWDNFILGVATDFENPRYYNIKWLTQLLEVGKILNQIGSLFPQEND